MTTSISQAVTNLLKALAFALISTALVAFFVWWLVPIITAGAVVLSPGQAAAGVALFAVLRSFGGK